MNAIRLAVIVLLGIMMFCPKASGQRHATIDVHKACSAPDHFARGTPIAEITKASMDTGWADGFIVGVAEAMPGAFDLPEKEGDLIAAVCRYIDLHPEMWNEDAVVGVHDSVLAIYAKKN
jgi:hypothetical protein